MSPHLYAAAAVAGSLVGAGLVIGWTCLVDAISDRWDWPIGVTIAVGVAPVLGFGYVLALALITGA